jgi:hypothetical protein
MMVGMAEPKILRQWGRNIQRERAGRQPDGEPRVSGADDRMSRSDLARLLDPPVDYSTVYRWEKGLMEPRRTQKVQLARILDIDERDLFPLSAVSGAP